MPHDEPRSRLLQTTCGRCQAPVLPVPSDHPDAASILALYPLPEGADPQPGMVSPAGRHWTPVGVFHDRCVDDSEVLYSINIPRTGITEEFLLHWTAHMMEKVWVNEDSTWSLFLRGIVRFNRTAQGPV